MPQKNEYEELRKKNMEDNKAFLKDLMKDLEFITPTAARRSSLTKRTNAKRKSVPTFAIRRNPSRRSRPAPYDSSFSAGPVTRSRARRGSESSGNTSRSSSPSRDGDNYMRIRFGSFYKRHQDDSDDDDDEERSPRKRRASSRALPHVIRAPEDITEVELKMVCDFSTGKKYDQTWGTSCHQCRQKTIDMKTICRSETCYGVRGQFCGPCLRNRYGEDAREALKDPDWTCPPCREICNCSICRNRNGKTATGILLYVAQQEGFDNVKDYLASLKKK